VRDVWCRMCGVSELTSPYAGGFAAMVGCRHSSYSIVGPTVLMCGVSGGRFVRYAGSYCRSAQPIGLPGMSGGCMIWPTGM